PPRARLPPVPSLPLAVGVRPAALAGSAASSRQGLAPSLRLPIAPPAAASAAPPAEGILFSGPGGGDLQPPATGPPPPAPGNVAGGKGDRNSGGRQGGP